MESLNKNINHYLRQIERLKIVPNFWASKEHLIKSQAVWVEEKGLSGFKLEKDAKEWFLPPLDSWGQDYWTTTYAGWPDEHTLESTFLDYQFIYNPQDFQDMSGGKWKVFRKNIRKYPKRINKPLLYITIHKGEFITPLSIMLDEWGQNRKVFDTNTFVRFVLHGDNRKGLFVDNNLVGLNVWDENYWYINYRCCIDNGSPFLNEYMRYLFYTDVEIIQKHKLVNDGGSLGSETLYKFKQKLNPHQVMKIYSHK